MINIYKDDKVPVMDPSIIYFWRGWSSLHKLTYSLLNVYIELLS